MTELLLVLSFLFMMVSFTYAAFLFYQAHRILRSHFLGLRDTRRELK